MSTQSVDSDTKGMYPKNQSVACSDCGAIVGGFCWNKKTSKPMKSIHPARQEALKKLKAKAQLKAKLKLVPKADGNPKQARLLVHPIMDGHRSSVEHGDQHFDWMIRKYVDCPTCEALIGSPCVTSSGKQCVGVHKARMLDLKEKFESGIWDTQLGIIASPGIEPAELKVPEPEVQVGWPEDAAIKEHGDRIKRARGVINILVRVAGWERTLDHLASALVEHDVDQKILEEGTYGK
jgi:hypothetical protein